VITRRLASIARTAASVLTRRNPDCDSNPPPTKTDLDAENRADLERVSAKLRDLGFPAPGEWQAKPKRPKDRVAVAALKFREYVRIMHGSSYRIGDYETTARLYRQMCRLDHREPASPDHVLGKFVQLSGVYRNELVLYDETTGRTSWTRIYHVGWRRKRKSMNRRPPLRRKKDVTEGEATDEATPLRLVA